MERVTGIGGFFFRAKDPEALGRWYEEQFGIDRVPPTYDARPWWQDAGPTVWNPYSEVGEYFGGGDYEWILNFRVRDLDAMVEQLRSSGTDVEVDSELYPNGRFAKLLDPEGNLIQLWEPTPAELRASDTQG